MADIKKAERVYVALSYFQVDAWTHKPSYIVLAVGKAGESKDSLLDTAEQEVQKEANSGLMFDTLIKNTFIISMSAFKRSYSRLYQSWLEE